MLHVSESHIQSDPMPQNEDAEFGSSLPSIEQIIGAVRRQIWVLVAGAVIGAVIGLIYLFTTVPLYTSSASILIDKSQTQAVDEAAVASGVFKDDAEMLSQVELLRSESLARKVVETLNLTENSAFTGEGGFSPIASLKSGIKSLFSVFGSSEPEVAPTREQLVQEAASSLQDGVKVDRVGLTYALSLSYVSPDRTLSKQVVDAYADAYIDDQLNARFDATRRASTWLQDRIADLRGQAFEADLAVQRYRAENNLQSAGGTLVSEQQLGEINSQLITAQATTAEAKARYDQIENLIASGRTDAVVNDALASGTITTLRERYLDASRRESEISSKLGENHVQAVRLRAEMADYERLIFQELKRIADSYNNNYQVAQSRQKSLEDNLAKALNVNAAAGTTQVRLRELERQSETLKSLYDNFLTRYQATLQQQSFPSINARVITPASLAEFPSHPKKPLVLALFLMLGVAAASGVAVVREYRDRFFRTGDQVRNGLGIEFLGFTPELTAQDMSDKSQQISQAGGSLFPPGSPALYVQTHPISSFAETLRNAKVAVDMTLPDQASKVIGIISCLPGEGKSTISANLAQLLAMQGAKTLIIDGDMRNPGLSRMLAEKPKSGLVETLLNPNEAAGTLLSDASGRFSLLPVVLRQRVFHSSELLSSPRMSKLINDSRAHYDYVLLDLPPIGPVVDAKAVASRVDAFVFVVQWGHTSRKLVHSLLATNPTIRNKCVGVILNRSDEAKLKLYRSYGSAEFYHQEYTQYFER